jgi:NADH:ubiquinone oxidoreductase subunit E
MVYIIAKLGWIHYSWMNDVSIAAINAQLLRTTEEIRARAMLIKELQSHQHHHGYLPREVLSELAERLKAPFFEVYGVASFYPHFRLEPPAGTELKICTDLSCHLARARALKAAIEAECEHAGLKGPCRSARPPVWGAAMRQSRMP